MLQVACLLCRRPGTPVSLLGCFCDAYCAHAWAVLQTLGWHLPGIQVPPAHVDSLLRLLGGGGPVNPTDPYDTRKHAASYTWLSEVYGPAVEQRDEAV